MPNTLTDRPERVPFGGVEDYARLAKRGNVARSERKAKALLHSRAMALSELEQIINTIGKGDLNAVPIQTMVDWSIAWGFDPPEDYNPPGMNDPKLTDKQIQALGRMAPEFADRLLDQWGWGRD